MKIIIILFIFLTILSCQNVSDKPHDQPNNVINAENRFWDIEKEKQHNHHRNDSTKWSTDNWKIDTLNIRLTGDPIVEGVYPVPRYELVDSTFNGLGYSGDWKGLEFKGKKIIYHSLFVKRNDVNKYFIDNKEDEVFFTIVVLTDNIDLDTYTHTNVSITSRNHPHYVGQGFVKTKNNKIDFVSFITADRNAYALINMRLFDLRIGRVVLIAPQKDKTVRSLQLSVPLMTSSESEKTIKSLIENDKQAIEFSLKRVIYRDATYDLRHDIIEL